MKFAKLLLKNKSVEPQTYEAVYGAMVQSKIRERYSLSAELSILRKRDKKPEEFAEYDNFAEACKAEVKRELGETDIPIPSEPEQNSNELQ